MSDQYLIDAALELMRGSPDYLDDARIGAPLGNSVIGSVLNLTHKAPRWATEQAVIEAIAILDQEEPNGQEPGFYEVQEP